AGAEGLMRTMSALLVVLVTGLAPCQPGRPDDQEAKKRRQELEKMLAEIEPLLEKEEGAVKSKQTIAALKKVLDQAERIDVFRLDPKGLAERDKAGKKEFHGYEVLAEARVGADAQRAEVASFLGKTLHWNEGRKALCFHPRHGLRAESGKQ